MHITKTVDINSCIVNNRLHVQVKPNARKTAIISVEGDVVHIAIAAPPQDGAANAELERFLRKLTGKKAVVKSGFTSKKKTVLLQ